MENETFFFTLFEGFYSLDVCCAKNVYIYDSWHI